MPQEDTLKPLPTAADNDALSGADLASAVQFLNDQADGLNALKAAASPQEIEEIATQQVALRGRATELIAAKIQWIAGQPKLDVEHVQAAIDYTQQVIDNVATIKKRLDALTAVVGFFGQVLTGSPVKIVQAGVKLKQDLDKIQNA